MKGFFGYINSFMLTYLLLFPSEKRPDNSFYVNFVNLLRMIKKTSRTNKQRTPGLGSGTHKTSVSVLNKILF